MGNFRATEAGAEPDSIRNEERTSSITSNREQSEATTENIIRRKKKGLPRKFHAKKIGIGILVFILAASAGLLIFSSRMGISLFYIRGDSMYPTFTNGTSVILRQAKSLEPGQIAFLETPNDWPNPFSEKGLLVKRVVAIPGETMIFQDRTFTINGREYPLPDDYSCTNAPESYSHTLKNDEIMVFGDNSSHSIDSRYMFCNGSIFDAFVKKKQLVDYGKVIKQF